MPPRSFSSGTISFGLVSIPVNVYSASESSAAVSFHLLHGKCHTRLKMQYVCPKDQEVVDRKQMVKGFEFAKDQYVVFTEEEIKAMGQESKKTIEITEFVPLDQVDPIYFDRAYYLGPDQGGDRAYHLLARVMQETGRCALAKWSARGKQYLVMVRPMEGGLVMQQLHYSDEVLPFSEVPKGDADVKEGEVKLGLKLVEQITSEEFDPEKYVDEVRKTMQEAIRSKVEGKEVTMVVERPRGKIIDLMEALKASVGAKESSAAGEKSGKAAAGERRPARRAARSEERTARRKRA